MKKFIVFTIALNLILCCFLINVYADNTQLNVPTDAPQVTEEPEIPVSIKGDVNYDSCIDASDALIILKLSAKLCEEINVNDVQILGDVDENQVIDANDALNVLKYAASLIKSFDEIITVVIPTEIPEEYNIISAGQTKNVTISSAKEKVTFEFTPTESGYYRYHSSGKGVAEFGTISDSDGKLLMERQDYAYIEYGWHHVYSGKFSFDFYFEAGKTYYLDAFLEENNIGSFDVTLMPLEDAKEVIIKGNEPIDCPYGTEIILNVAYAPEYSIDFVDTWESSNTEIVTVDEDGKIKGVGLGKANITVTTVNGLTYSAEVEVKDHPECYVGDVIEFMALFENSEYYKFVPETDGEYIFKTYRDWHNFSPFFISVYDSAFNEILYNESGIDYEILCNLKVGETYYISMYCDAGDNGFVQYFEIIK